MKIVRANLIRAGLDIKGPKNPVATAGDVPASAMGGQGHVLGGRQVSGGFLEAGFMNRFSGGN
jgi:hypothetical protein